MWVNVVFSKTLQNRYQELYRACRQWRNLKQQKWSGFAYENSQGDKPGSLALFCAACPQPGINIPRDWKMDTDSLVYARSFVMDGNFTAVHQKRQNAAPESRLTNGDLYMVDETPYNVHLRTAKESVEVTWLFVESFDYLSWYRNRPVMSIML
jgi:hypothetical protein